ncbi:MAG TPA: hypothetical protein VJZ27_02500, partial [Aggregatilineales bacterium]|nr:hypothetical protein [Aggregatilineales bacterium]
YADMSYKNLAKVERQFPDVGGVDLYYGGTAYNNRGGLGVQWAVDAEDESKKIRLKPVESKTSKTKGLLAVPVRRLYDRSPEFAASEMMHLRIPEAYADINQVDADKNKIKNGDSITLDFGGHQMKVTAYVNGAAPEGVVLVPQGLTADPVPAAPVSVTLKK